MPTAVKTVSFLTYDTERFPFARLLASQVFKIPALESLHIYWQRYKAGKGTSIKLGYEDNLKLRKLMQSLPNDSLFYRLYHAFAREVVAASFGRRISYSSHPKMRVHLAGTDSVSAWHRDVDITKRPDQINVWLPFTDTFGGNTLWIETDYGNGRYQPVEVAYGQVLIFDGGYLSHGTVANDTDSTRVSLDFRFAIIGPDMPARARAIFTSRPP